MESTRAMTRERGISHAQSKNCEILLLPTADRRFDPKVKCPTGRASFWVKFPTVRSLTELKMPGDCPGGMGGFGIDWYIIVSQQRQHFEDLSYFALHAEEEEESAAQRNPASLRSTSNKSSEISSLGRPGTPDHTTPTLAVESCSSKAK